MLEVVGEYENGRALFNTLVEKQTRVVESLMNGG